jgi:hypothetical protein
VLRDGLDVPASSWATWSPAVTGPDDERRSGRHLRGVAVGVAVQLRDPVTELRGKTRHVAGPGQLTITWGMEPDNHAAQRFDRRLGASLRDKVLAGWLPEACAAAVVAEAP